MKTKKKLEILVRSISLGTLTMMMLFSLASCSTKTLFLNSSVVPAARGYIKVKTDKNNNYVIQVQITNLAGVERRAATKANLCSVDGHWPGKCKKHWTVKQFK